MTIRNQRIFGHFIIAFRGQIFYVKERGNWTQSLYYNHSDPNERDNKDFKVPIVCPTVFFSGKDTLIVPFNLRDKLMDLFAVKGNIFGIVITGSHLTLCFCYNDGVRCIICVCIWITVALTDPMTIKDY